jgi:hypothetical protein
MCFDRALGDVELPGDFRVVASLEKQLDDLPFAGSDLAELFFQKNVALAPKRAPVAAIGALPTAWTHHGFNLSASHFAFTRPNRPLDG